MQQIIAILSATNLIHEDEGRDDDDSTFLRLPPPHIARDANATVYNIATPPFSCH